MDQPPSDVRGFPLTARRMIVALSAIALTLLIARNTIVELALDSRRAVGLSSLVWPRDGGLNQIDAGVVVQDLDWKKHDPQAIFAIASDAHRLDPLDNWPFMLAGSLFERVGDSDRAIMLFDKSVRLDPRSPAPRLHLIQNLIAARRGDEALTQIVRFARLRPDQDKLLLQALIILLVRDPEHRLIARLNEYPDVRDRLLAQASQSDEAEPFMAELLSQRGVERELRWEQIDRLAQRGSIQTAYDIWSKSPTGAVKGIYDADFQGRDGPAAFRWRLDNSSKVVADFSRETAGGPIALDVEMFGDTLAEAAQQTVRIAPGSHRVSIVGQAIEPPEIGGEMRWEISCASDDRLLVRISFPMVPKRVRRSADIVVPQDGCAFQKIVLTGVPEAGSQPFRMRFSRISID